MYISRAHTRERASVICDDEEGDLFHSAGPHKNLCQPQLTQKKARGRFWTASYVSADTNTMPDNC